jgi:hypothetical protein
VILRVCSRPDLKITLLGHLPGQVVRFNKVAVEKRSDFFKNGVWADILAEAFVVCRDGYIDGWMCDH